MMSSDAKSATDLNSGWGVVMPEAQVHLKLPVSLAMSGGALDFFSGVFNAVHRNNRRAPEGGYIAVGVPDLQPGARGLQAFGRSLLLVGARDALRGLLEDDRIDRVSKRHLEYSLSGGTAGYVAPDSGAALVRTRQGDNWAPGRVRNRLARLDRDIAEADCEERKAMLQATRDRVVAHADIRWQKRRPVDAFMKFGRVSVGMNLVQATAAADGRIIASTWGLSRRDFPLVFTPTAVDLTQPATRKRSNLRPEPRAFENA